jgi:hypothetical protein
MLLYLTQVDDEGMEGEVKEDVISFQGKGKTDEGGYLERW